MKIKKNNGLAGVDVIIAVIAISIFSTLIVTMMYNNVMQNVKLKKDTLAMIYMTEIMENIGIEDYENLSVGEYKYIGKNNHPTTINNLVPEQALKNYNVDMVISDELDGITNGEDIIKKVEVTLSYKINDKMYICSMQRMKIKE